MMRSLNTHYHKEMKEMAEWDVVLSIVLAVSTAALALFTLLSFMIQNFGFLAV
jgi:hypothetical protein